MPQSLLNLIPGGAATPLVAGGTPSVNATSGMTVSFANPVTTGIPQDQSEPYMIVVSNIVYGTGANPTKPIDNISGSNTSNVQMIMGSSGWPGPSCEIAYTNSGGTGAQLGCSLQVGGANSAATIAAILAPNFYVCKVDMANMLISMKSMSPVGIAAGWGSGTGAISAAIPAGATRTANTVPIRLGGYQSNTGTNGSLIHFFAKFNRVTTVAEDAAMYAAVQTALGLRGVTI